MAEQKQSLYLRVQEKLSNVSTVNSYKELCKLLDEPNYSSPSQKKFQKKQLENWKKCFTWRKNKDKVYHKGVPKKLSFPHLMMSPHTINGKSQKYVFK